MNLQTRTGDERRWQTLCGKRDNKNSSATLISDLAPVVQTLDSAIHRINHYPADSVIDFRNTYPLDRDLSTG